MRIGIVTPAAAGSRTGNRLTALRWARLLRQLGHRVVLAGGWDGDDWDALVALHARKSHPAVAAFRARRPERPIVVAMTGTDLYDDVPRGDRQALASLELADRVVVLHAGGADDVPASARAKVRAIAQSATRPHAAPLPDDSVFQVCVLGHLRAVKDPLLPAEATRLLPDTSRVRVVHVGGTLDDAFAGAAREAESRCPRWRWLGELSHKEALRTLASSRLLALPSRIEGGANAVYEAIACGVPIVASRHRGALGQLGGDYPGLFPVGDAGALAALLRRCETEPAFLADLARRCARLLPLVDPARERDLWRQLLVELTG